MRHRLGFLTLLVASVVSTSATTAIATLAKDVCDGLKTEQDALAAKGVKDDIAKGPAAAKANLKADRLGEIKRYIEIDEQLLFRCGLARARYVAPPELEAQAAAPEPEKKAAIPKAKPKPKPPEKAAAKADAAAPGAEVAPAKTVQAKPKPKADDAFRPPASTQQPKQ